MVSALFVMEAGWWAGSVMKSVLTGGDNDIVYEKQSDGQFPVVTKCWSPAWLYLDDHRPSLSLLTRSHSRQSVICPHSLSLEMVLVVVMVLRSITGRIINN